MRVNDMSHMAEIFTTPLLPYREFLVTHGEHQAQLMQGGKLGKHYHARYEFPCGTEVSVISGPLFYCSLDAPYEYRIGEGEPQGYQTDEELYLLLTKIVAGEKPKENREGYMGDYMGGDAEHRLQDDAVHPKPATAYTTNPHAPPRPLVCDGYDLHRRAADEAHPK